MPGAEFWLLGSGKRRSFVLVIFLLWLGGCSPVYVLRAGYEEARILWRRQPIETVLRTPITDEERSKLELVLAVRDYARDTLGLAVDGSYASISRVDQDQIVHVVTAAPWNKLAPVTWWFPIVGRVPYRGYFDLEGAKAFARRLEADGYDTWVRPSIAFSTLGWFDDPLLSNLLRHDRATLANVIIHELLHNTIYLKGQGAFNESFATFVGGRGAIEFFAQRGESADLDQARQRHADALLFSRFLGRWMATLQEAYSAGLTREDRERLFEHMQEDFQREAWQTKDFADFPVMRLNNAILVHEWIYYRELDLFERVLNEQGNLRSMIEYVRRVAAGTPDPFAALRLRVGPPQSELRPVHSGRTLGTRHLPLSLTAVAPPGSSGRDARRER